MRPPTTRDMLMRTLFMVSTIRSSSARPRLKRHVLSPVDVSANHVAVCVLPQH